MNPIIPTRSKSQSTMGFFDPHRFKTGADVLQSILPYPESIMEDSDYMKLLQTTKPPVEPTISQEPIGVEESKQ